MFILRRLFRHKQEDVYGSEIKYIDNRVFSFSLCSQRHGWDDRLGRLGRMLSPSPEKN
jgi:hypothetical protein